MPSGTTIINMDNESILKVNFDELPSDHQLLITKAAEEFREKCLLSYSKTRDKVVQKTPLPRVLLHGQNDLSEEAKARAAAHLVHKPISEAFTNHNQHSLIHRTLRLWEQCT
jgi:hypothetical protein